jgi:hypothetical protein
VSTRDDAAGPLPLAAFYRGGRDNHGRTLDEILDWDWDRLESTHDYIQWLFPLRERSGANPSAPVLSNDEVAAFRDDAELRTQLQRAWRVMLAFYGFTVTETSPLQIRRSADHQLRCRVWLYPGSHNFLRLTRMLRSLRTLGLEAEARATFAVLSQVVQEHPFAVSRTTYGFWQRAMQDALP